MVGMEVSSAKNGDQRTWKGVEGSKPKGAGPRLFGETRPRPELSVRRGLVLAGVSASGVSRKKPAEGTYCSFGAPD